MPLTRPQELPNSRPAEAALLPLVALAIRQEAAFPSLTAVEWERVFTLASKHRVAGLLAAVVAEHAALVPLEVRLKFAAMQQRTVQATAQRKAVLMRLLTLFGALGIPTMVVKGVAISRYYPEPSLRAFSDLDIYQFGHYREADRAVGDTFGVEISRKTHHHTKYTIDGVLVENHYDFTPRHGAWGNRRSERVLKCEAARGCVDFAIGGQPCLLASPQFNALFLMRHMAVHFAAEAISIRHLLDWTFFCQAEREMVDWAKAASQMRQMGMLDFALAIEEICHRWFGCQGHLAATTGRSSNLAMADRVLTEIFAAESRQLDEAVRPAQRLRAKWMRLRESRWKHDLCYPAPWLFDLPLMLCAKLIRPHTILH
ncbi:MAG: nucleotidyltransferase family protein [Bacteroidales bacterium]|nr:nucleotidyltransferase family protein [Bacteroidales bacterium]